MLICKHVFRGIFQAARIFRSKIPVKFLNYYIFRSQYTRTMSFSIVERGSPNTLGYRLYYSTYVLFYLISFTLNCMHAVSFIFKITFAFYMLTANSNFFNCVIILLRRSYSKIKNVNLLHEIRTIFLHNFSELRQLSLMYKLNFMIKLTPKCLKYYLPTFLTKLNLGNRFLDNK